MPVEVLNGVVGTFAEYTTPAWITSLDFSDIGSIAGDLAGKVGPAIILVMVPIIGIKLLKKFIGKIG